MMKNLDKVLKAIGEETKVEMDAMEETSLRNVIVQAQSAMSEVQSQLDNNVEYQRISELKNDMTQGKKEVDKRQKAKIAYALMRLNEVGANLGSTK
jgi:anti-sigma28 factor (negative regulator of flagellin synthesis)